MIDLFILRKDEILLNDIDKVFKIAPGKTNDYLLNQLE
jgi:hypothetical protein